MSADRRFVFQLQLQVKLNGCCPLAKDNSHSFLYASYNRATHQWLAYYPR